MKTIHDPRYRELIELLIRLREEAMIKQTDLSLRLGKPQSYVAKVENFDRRLDIVELSDWLSGLHVEPAKIFEELSWWRG